MAEKYTVRVQGSLVEVTEEVYRAYYGIERHLLTLDEKDARNGKTLYSDLDTDETLGEEMLPDADAVSVEDAAIAHREILAYGRLQWHRRTDQSPAQRAEYDAGRIGRGGGDRSNSCQSYRERND